jgi:hypothetical protein
MLAPVGQGACDAAGAAAAAGLAAGFGAGGRRFGLGILGTRRRERNGKQQRRDQVEANDRS